MADESRGLFREKSLERLSSPERLDQLLELIDRRSWLPLAALSILILGLVVWSIFGRIPINVHGRGILIHSRSVVEIDAPGAGQLVRLDVQVGDVVEAGDPLGRIEQPELEMQLRLTRQKRDELTALSRAAHILRSGRAADDPADLDAYIDESLELADELRREEVHAVAAERQLIVAQLDRARHHARSMEQIWQRHAEAHESKAISELELLDAEADFIDSQTRVSNLESRLVETKTGQLEITDRYLTRLQRLADLRLDLQDYEQQIGDTRREIARLEAQIAQRGRIVCEVAGTILEIYAFPGQYLTPGQPIGAMSVGAAGSPLESVVYFSIGDGKRIEPGDRIQITPDTVERARFGGIVGIVESVSTYAVTVDDVANQIGNRGIAETIVDAGYRIRVRATLVEDPRTPTRLKWSSSRVECGAASLGIILAHFGRIVPLSELRAECGVSRDGSNAANVVKAARRYNLKAKGFSARMADVRKMTGPYIVFWNFNHFLVVEGFRRDRVYLNDPASGRRRVTIQDFDESFTGVVLLMEPDDEFTRGGRKPSVILALADRLRGLGRDLLFSIAAGVLLVAPGLAIPMMTQLFVDQVLIDGRSDWLRPVLLAIGGMALLRVVLRFLQLRFLRELRTKLAIKLSGGFLWHVLRLPVGFFAQRFAGEVSSRVALNNEIANVLSGQLATVVIDCMMLLFYGAVMLYYDVPLTLVGVSLALVNVFALRWIGRQRVDANMRLRQEDGKVAGVAIAGLQSIETLKASALESSFFGRWSGYYSKATGARQELGLTNQILGVFPGLLSALTTMLILVFGGWRVIQGEISIGMLVAFQGMMAMFQGPVGTLVGLGGKLQTLEGDMKRVDDVLLHPLDPEVTATTREEESSAEVVKLDGFVELRNVTFGYSRVAPPLIENLSLKIRPGERLALVGGSGSGKSTVAKLICGLYEPWSGEILLDGKPRARLSRRLLANSLAIVDQDLLFFAGTVRDNLALWDSTVTREQLRNACADAAIEDVVLSLPGGYDAPLMEGAANLSGGQRQRLEIARALVNRPSILVLDEATSALDAETEFVIDRNLRTRGCTTLVVAHRLSTIRDAEEILVMTRGKVVQRGRHEQLWNEEGEYARLIRSAGGSLQS